MGNMVYSLLWVMQDVYHQPYYDLRYIFLKLRDIGVSGLFVLRSTSASPVASPTVFAV